LIPVKQRVFRTIVHVLVAAQLLLSAPVVSALANSMASGASEMPCADIMPPDPGSDPCPCCPDGDMNEAACLSACMASMGAIATQAFSAVLANAVSGPLPPEVRIVHIADPPLKPPPIV
jgi:hypothetical protein